MKFTFRFASVLKLRRHQEKKEKQKLGIIFKKKALLKQKVFLLEEKCRETGEQPERQSMIKNRQQYAQKHAHHKRLTNLKKQLLKIDEEVKAQQRRLAEANKKTRMMEKLKNNEKRSFIQEVERAEQYQQNEIAIQRFNSN